VPETLGARLAEFASSLRNVGAIQSDAVEHAFASVARHRCVPQFRYGPKTITVPQNEQPGSEVLDIIYFHQSLLTSTGQDGDPPSSSSAPTLMARMLEALNLCPGMRVLEIGAGTGYNAALITTITKAPVVTVDAGATTAQGAAESIRWLGLDHQVTVLPGDGYLGEPNSAPYDRIIVTCGVAGLSPHWLDQLAPGGLILAPIAHGGVHPVLAATNRTTATYNDLWFFLATRDSRITRAYMDDDTVDTTKGSCALRTPRRGTAWVHTDGSITAAGEPTVADELRSLIHE
jgi:protein-L-isoaspartate(D-aspartate) O-methyltransferase